MTWTRPSGVRTTAFGSAFMIDKVAAGTTVALVVMATIRVGESAPRRCHLTQGGWHILALPVLMMGIRAGPGD